MAERLTASLGVAALACLVTAGCEGGERTRRTDSEAYAQVCPGVDGETVHLVVPFTAGGGYDVYARLVEPFYEEAIGAEIVVETRAGAGGRVGARMIRDAEPDGRTIGIVNAFSLLVAGLSEGLTGFHPVNDFTVLAQLATAPSVWVTAKGSPYGSIDDVMSRPDSEPILVGLTDLGSSGFVSLSVGAELLELEVAYLSGYPGTRESSLGLMKGDFDILGITFESIRDRIEAGDLTPILQVSDRPIADHPSLQGVPLLGGPDGLAAQEARERGEDPVRVVALAAALSGLLDAGRLVVGPRDLPPELAGCLADGLAGVARDSAFLAAASRAQRTITYAGPATVAADLAATEAERLALAPILRKHADLARGGPRAP